MQQELAGCEFRDERLGKRFSMVLRQLSEANRFELISADPICRWRLLGCNREDGP